MGSNGVPATRPDGSFTERFRCPLFEADRSAEGGGWVRIAILAIFVVTAWGAFNAPSVVQALQAMPTGDQLARLLALVALGTMLAPSAHRWFAAAKHAGTEVAE